jgi:glucose/arabinose dehydrogenase
MKTRRMAPWLASLAAAVLTVALGRVMGGSLAQPPAVEISVSRIVASGLERPVQVTHAGDGSARLFVVEQPGRIRVIKAGVLLPAPFLDVSQLVVLGGEQGLLGLAFHPQYSANGYFYVNYTRAGDGATVVARYSVSASDPDLADPESALTILIVDQPAANHNGGQIAFGPHDGYLYVGMGDGGGVGDPADNGQNIDTLLGALLRLDVDTAEPYAIPAGNPFAGGPGADEIWAFGLRNPWRFSFDRVTGDLYIGDVGQSQWEEIDYQAAGAPGGVNFGWSCREGAHDYDFTGDCLTATLTDPIAEYGRAEGQAVSGGFVYRGSAYPALQGRYFYADYVQGKIWSLVKTGSDPDTWSLPELELDTSLNISSFGEDEAGELYVVDLAGGTVRRLADANAPAWFLLLPMVMGGPNP